MKKSRYLFVGVLVALVIQINSSLADEWSGPKTNVLLNNWSVNLNFGFTSYFGDLSQYDIDPLNKLFYESKPACGVKLTKHLKGFGIAGQLIYGGFKSDYKPEHIFETSLLEYTIQGSIDVFSLLFPSTPLKYGMEVYAGTGQFMFRTVRYVQFDGLQTPEQTGTGVPEFVYFFGSSVYYNVTDKIRITTDLSIRQAQNDNIDKYVANGDFDYYSLLNVGISYSLGKLTTVVRDESRQKINNGAPVWRTSR